MATRYTWKQINELAKKLDDGEGLSADDYPLLSAIFSLGLDSVRRPVAGTSAGSAVDEGDEPPILIVDDDGPMNLTEQVDASRWPGPRPKPGPFPHVGIIIHPPRP
jgi:hypothetical protein